MSGGKAGTRYNQTMTQPRLKRAETPLPPTPELPARNHPANDNRRPIAANDNSGSRYIVHTITDNVTPANNQTLTWDVIDRMKSVTGAFAVSSITYDSNSNRLTYGPGTSYTVPSGSDLMSLAGASAIGYTSTGNISSNGASTTFAYSKANRMASATVSGTTSTYTYDAFGQRLKVKVGGGTAVQFSYDQSRHLLSEINSGTETDYAYIDDMPLSAIQPGATTISALHTDLIGTVQRATDSTKTINWTGNYQPFGAVSPTTTITMNLRYPGMYKDATGFNHNGFRDYIQSYGRHPEADPLGLAAGLNPYIYVLNNPLKYTDPWGLDTQYFASVGGTIAVIGGVGGGFTIGVSIPDKPQNYLDWQLFVSGQGNAMLGLGIYAGYGVSGGISTSDGPLPRFSGAWQPYIEADIGLGPLSAGASVQGDNPASSCTVSDPSGKTLKLNNPSYSASIPGLKIGQGVGIYAGAGGAASVTRASPFLSTIFGRGQR
jgi:RHS repeat-associated protein